MSKIQKYSVKEGIVNKAKVNAKAKIASKVTSTKLKIQYSKV
jgi:hypothetical protein